MTEHKWKPVPHEVWCKTWIHDRVQCSAPCNGTRWSGYGERVWDAMGVRGLCVLFERLGGMVTVPEQPTPAMVRAGWGRDVSDSDANAAGVYRAMLAASRREGGGE